MSDEPETGTTETEGKAVATIKKAPLAVGDEGYITPKTVEEAARMAQAIIIGGFAPDSYKVNGTPDPNKILLGIMSAMEAGLPPLYGLRQIAIINNRPTIWGDGAMALVQQRSLISDYTEEQVGPIPTDKDLSKWDDEYGWKVTIKRRGQQGSYVGIFTVGMAKRSKLWMHPKKVPWIEYPDRMLKIRARAFPLRDGFADALAGLAIREEVEDMHMIEKVPVDVRLNDEPEVEAPPLDTEEQE